MTIKFETGHTYSTRSPCDQDTVIAISVLSRTTRTIKTTCGKTLRVAEYEGQETVKPWGSYSMAPIIKAKPVSAEKAVTLGDKHGSSSGAQSGNEKRAADLVGVANPSALIAEPAPHNTAKIYHFTAYRK